MFDVQWFNCCDLDISLLTAGINWRQNTSSHVTNWKRSQISASLLFSILNCSVICQFCCVHSLILSTRSGLKFDFLCSGVAVMQIDSWLLSITQLKRVTQKNYCVVVLLKSTYKPVWLCINGSWWVFFSSDSKF